MLSNPTTVFVNSNSTACNERVRINWERLPMISGCSSYVALDMEARELEVWMSSVHECACWYLASLYTNHCKWYQCCFIFIETLYIHMTYHLYNIEVPCDPIAFKADGQAKAALQSTKPRCDNSTQKLKQLIQMEATVDQAAPSTPRAGIFRASMPNTKTASKILSSQRCMVQEL